MLSHLDIRNFTLVDELSLDLKPGLTAITGETGAGKSITLDALGLALGDRADSGRVRHGAQRADITASFDISPLSEVQNWLREQALDMDDECILRRTVTRDGRSRGWINGQPATLQQLRELGEMLVDLHGQHEHQSLLKKHTHYQVLDAFGQHQALTEEVKTLYRQWQQQNNLLEQLLNNAEENSARYQLLAYQVEELEQLALQEQELKELEQEQETLANADDILQRCQQADALFDADEGSNLLSLIKQAEQLLHGLPESPATLEINDMVGNARIQIEEAKHSLQHFADGVELDPQRLNEVEQRLSAIYDIARKHRVQPNELPQLQNDLQSELDSLNCSDERLEALQAEVEAAYQAYLKQGRALSKARRQSAQALQSQVQQQLQKLAMESARLEVALEPVECVTGLELVEFMISTNPGQQPGPLAKIASGGELSRISLAIQVVTAQTSTTPTIVFDEVDVGIGGATGDIVGRLLRELGNNAQVLCVTHLAQVASKGHQHWRVEKRTSAESAATTLVDLQGEDKVEEIARMIGGQISTQSRAHAREMMQL